MLFAQSRTLTGKVIDADNGEGIIAATVLVKGTSQGTVTDFDGTFSLSVPAGRDTLVVSYVGYQSRTVSVAGKSKITSRLGGSVDLSEVVVTALGVEREEKALGYSVQKLDAEQISTVKPTNVTNPLAGKVAGVYVTGGSTGPTASANINIRGAASLLGNNQPLFVVIGLPITNDLYTFDDGLNGSTTIDFGNAAQIVNPDDVASVNVLKGPAASALYGARAANGVILIETKTGQNIEGWGVDIGTTTTVGGILKMPDFQNEYGFGGGGKYSYVNGTNYIGPNESYEAYGENWGPRMNGQLIRQFNSNGEAVPFTPAEDNVRDFYQTAVTSINNVAINNATDDGDIRLSYTRLDNRGIVPNTGVERNTFQTSIGRRLFDDRLKIRLNAMFVDAGSDNVPNAGYDESSSVQYGWLWYPRQVEIGALRDYWQPGQEGVQQRYVENLWVNNPWFIANENTNSFQSNRLIGNLKLEYEIAPRLDLRLRYGTDVLDEGRQYRRAPSTRGILLGSYREDEISFYETNAESLLSYGSDLEYVAEEGELYGLGFVRDPETNQIIHQDGLPLIGDEEVSAGSYQPDLRLGVMNSFPFGPVKFSFLVDGQIGGRIYSRSHALYATGGTITDDDDPNLPLSTLDGRQSFLVDYNNEGEPVYTVDEPGTGVVGPGLKWTDENGNGEIDHATELSPNDVAVQPGGVG
ncbi:carboxypeptidase-like regulatory domain-containing protein [Lewinella sp. IMCC34183]|uniref:carboxypeptidase-like regulatory domain-containing protein n=1 Tax=Lewinella sp. IMCC34183 TaxID=2248762 RepID=UPI0018E53DDC|nr:carboxypeptidase-like regulatory domain-containing protein [Lewinella sp. IMCC34183]